MDTVTLVENQIDDGQQLLDRLGEIGVVVRAACWLKPFEEDRWSLYIATPAVDEEGTLAVYRKVIPILRSLGNDWITGSDIKLVGEEHPIVQDAIDILRRFPHRTPTRSPRPLLGGIPVEEVYVYSPGKESITIYGMIFRGAPGGALHLSLEPHNPQTKLTVETDGNRKEYPAEIGTNWMVAAPEGAALERDEVGRMVLAWDLHGRRMRSDANSVWSFAKLGLHGFRFLREPT